MGLLHLSEVDLTILRVTYVALLLKEGLLVLAYWRACLNT